MYGIKELLEDILFIDSDFKIVSKSITMLESSKLQLSEALNIADKVPQTVIQNNNSLISEKVKCHDKAPEVGVLKRSDFPFFKYAPITSSDVESRTKFFDERRQKTAEIDPAFFRTPAMNYEEWKAANFELRHHYTRGANHGFHYRICTRKGFHQASDLYCIKFLIQRIFAITSRRPTGKRQNRGPPPPRPYRTLDRSRASWRGRIVIRMYYDYLKL
ncbi:hypothetical protein ANN_24333 [Periplaneta americana]|uniref:Uncharacterized protein n=1 Tax=Periplaneta americana TaxID=6978 RepID=A0ABQ8S344_PERAM|nr:hypothetical protein ANN_24333 [Periplaneta americana]